MSPAETAHMTRLIQQLPSDMTVLIIEHDMDVVFGVADRITVLYFGQVLASGEPGAVRASSVVQDAYLGGAADSPRVHT
jgi:branched-chain amino acid transport system ATP-binding protein